MNKMTVFFQFFVVTLLLVGTIIFIFRLEFIQAIVYGALGLLFFGYALLEYKKIKNKNKV